MKIPDNLTPAEEYRRVLETVCERAANFFNINLFPHYTKHDIAHSDRIIKLISSLLKFAPIELNDQEKFILCCAGYLHDIGMFTTKYIGNKKVEELSDEDRNEIRKQHHIFSSNLIKDSIMPSQEGTYDLGLNPVKDFVESIALVAKSHGEDSLKNVSSDKINDVNIRQDLLCVLLRLGDLLDIDKQRVNIDKIGPIISVNDISKIHWFSHSYVSGVDIKNFTIKIFFKFPVKYKDESQNEIAKSLMEHLTKKITDQIIHDKSIWRTHGIHWHETIERDEKYQETMTYELPKEAARILTSLKERTYKEDGGLGEIEFYWGGNRENANRKIQEYLETTNANEIFIAAIGFGTIEEVLNKPEVLNHIKKSMQNNSNFKIIFVLPGNENHLIKIRPDRDKEKLRESFKNGQKLLINFINRLEGEFQNGLNKGEILSKVELRNYRNKLIPRHFILYGNEDDKSTIFVGSYLGHTEGKKSYMIKLRKDVNKKNSQKNFVPGIFELFEKEINHIRVNSREDGNLHAMMNGIKGE